MEVAGYIIEVRNGEHKEILTCLMLGYAPLAQSAERFHGKEKVDSSILSGGSIHVRRKKFPKVNMAV